MPKKLMLSLSKKPVMTLGRNALHADRLVYFLVTNKPIKYPQGKSRIVYVGTTEVGARRVASSIASRAEGILKKPGFKKVDAYLLTYTRRIGPQEVWFKLERAILIMFLFEYGRIPFLNRVGHKLWPGKEFDYFSRNTLLKCIRAFE